MAVWLKAKYPEVKILARKPPNQEVLRADYNAQQNPPENWLPIISQELANSDQTFVPTATNACTIAPLEPAVDNPPQIDPSLDR